MDSHHSVTHLLADLKGGDQQAADELVKRYLERLIGVGRATYLRKFHNIPRPDEDEVDAAISAIKSFLKGQRKGKFPQCQDRNSLWNLLVKITVRKVYDQRERARAKKRGGGGKAALARKTDLPDEKLPVPRAVPIHKIVASARKADIPDEEAAPRRCKETVEQIIDRLPGPQLAAQLADTYRVAMESLKDPELRRIAEMDLEGNTKKEIGTELGLTERSVYRKLQTIHEQWDRRFADAQ